MNYLTLLIIYFISFIFIMLFILFGHSIAIHDYLIVKFFKSIYQNLLNLLPDWFLKLLAHIFNYFFYEKNYFFQAFYCAAVLICHGILVLDVLSILYYYSLTENHVYIMILSLFLNIVSYSTLCLSDPGFINKKSYNSLSNVYKHDQVFYKKQECDICQIIKPARTRHCKLCDTCVYRYDHHCIWSNCCIGGLNMRNFLGFLISAFIMCANSVYLGVKSLMYYVHYEQLWQAKYIDGSGAIKQMDIVNLIQHLFMTLPRVMFLVSCLSGIGLGLLGYLLYHFYLMSTNQTSIERHRVKLMQRKVTNKRNHEQRNLSVNWRPYDRGWKENLKEVLQPHNFVKKIK